MKNVSTVFQIYRSFGQFAILKNDQIAIGDEWMLMPSGITNDRYSKQFWIFEIRSTKSEILNKFESPNSKLS
jgi:hypothetical protein